jgi:hypothetical protein
MAFTNLASKLILNGMQVNSGPLGNGFPYLKFAWEVEMSAGTGSESKGLFSTGPLVAKTCELPRFSVETQVVNVYNHKTIVQTKMNYEPITMTFYDQTNGEAESTIWEFVKGQFDPSDASKKVGISPMVVTIKMKNLSGDGDDKVYTLTNAFITDAQHDTLDYGTSDPVLWTITLRYEDLQTNDFKGKTPGDKGAGIKPLPKPPTKPSVTKVPVTKPPKADAKKDDKVSNNWQYTDPMGADDGASIMAVAGTNTQSSPKKTTNWPSPLSTNKDYPTNPASPVASRPESGWKAQQVWDSKYASGWNADGTSKKATGTAGATSAGSNPSTGTNTAPTVTKSKDLPRPWVKPPSKELVAANKQFVKEEAEYVKDDKGMNPEYKKAYIAGLEKYPPRSKDLISQEISRKMAETNALRTAPRYASQTRTQNADGSMTDRYVPQSTNNNASATASQASKEQQYVNKGKKTPEF